MGGRLSHHRAPQIGFDHAWMRLYFFRRAQGQHLAEVQRQHAVRDARDQAHVVLDHDHRDAEVGLDVLDPETHVLGFLGVEARGGFVEQQQARPHRQRAGQFHHLAHAVGQADHQAVAVVLQVEELDDLLDLAAELQLGAAHRAGEQQVLHPAGMAVAMAADQQVLQHRGVLEELDVLEGAGDAVARHHMRRHARNHLALEAHLARGRPVERGDQVEDRRLAGAIGSDQREHLVGPDLEGHVVHGQQAAEADREIRGFEHRRRHFSCSMTLYVVHGQ
jgi:hypothetical protein